jgi:DNA-binding beta-propeller fold protein YncE
MHNPDRQDAVIMVKHSLFIAFGALLLTACATPQAPVERVDTSMLVYPPPPETARFYFERSIMGSADIEKVDAETKWRRALTGEAVISMGMSKPYDVESCQGTIFVSDTVSRLVYRFNVPTGEFDQIGTKDPGILRKPLGLATDEDCNIYVADQTAERIVKYDSSGRFMDAWGGAEMFDRLSHVEVDPAGERLYVVDTGGVRSERHHIRVIDTASGEVLFDIGKRGARDGELNLPRDIAMGSDGNLYVVDGGNFRVQVFTTEGRFLSSMGRIGSRTGNFSRPKGIDTDSEGNVYVSDAAFGNFQIFNRDGQLLLFVGDRAAEIGPGKFMLPAGIALDEDGRVYMVDQFFRKVDVFRPAGLKENEGFLGLRAN